MDILYPTISDVQARRIADLLSGAAEPVERPDLVEFDPTWADLVLARIGRAA